jgi:hypothetical protein
MSLSFGDERPGGPAKVAIGVAGALLLVITGGLASDGGADWYMPLIVIVPLCAVFVLWVLWRRRVEVDADRREVVITRTLFGLRWRRRIRFGAFTGVLCRGLWMRPRGGRPDEGTPEGDAHFIKVDLSLRRGWRGVHLDMLSGVAEAEAQGLQVARCVGVAAVRRDYVRRADGVPLWRRGSREAIG